MLVNEGDLAGHGGRGSGAIAGMSGCPDQPLGVQVVKHAHPNSYATMPIFQQAIARLK
jgi:hypothetical protein